QRHTVVAGDEYVARAGECAADGDGVGARRRRVRDPVSALLPKRSVRANIDRDLRGRRHIHARTRRRDKRDDGTRRRESPSGGGCRATWIVETELDTCHGVHIAAVHYDRNRELWTKN